MKITKKTQRTAVLIIALSVIVFAFAGCSERENPGASSKKTDETTAFVSKENSNEEVYHADLAVKSLSIVLQNETNWNDELVYHIRNSKNANPKDENYDLYSDNKISDIKKFYNLENTVIDGYQLYSVGVFDWGVDYSFAPTEQLKDKNLYEFNRISDVVSISISRENRSPKEVSEELKRMAEVNESYCLSENGFVYDGDFTSNSLYIRTQIDGTIFTMTAPNKFVRNDYERKVFEELFDKEFIEAMTNIRKEKCEYLYNLGLDIIKNAELVVVDKYKLSDDYVYAPATVPPAPMFTEPWAGEGWDFTEPIE